MELSEKEKIKLEIKTKLAAPSFLVELLSLGEKPSERSIHAAKKNMDIIASLLKEL